ncbi:hypothetical protein ACFL2I_01910 [Candidatus Omnitrophota bacterium]
MKINAKGLDYRQLNELIHQQSAAGAKNIILDNVNGQRYIGTGLSNHDLKITVKGVPGNDLAAFMDGPAIAVSANAQDGIADTMNAGKIVIHGDAGDIAGHSMRGGKVYIKGDAGYRAGIHMKSYKQLHPVIIIGGSAGDFLGEYMAGGLIIVLGLNKEKNEPLVGNYCATGMHGGAIYIRGEVEQWQLGQEVKVFATDQTDQVILKKYLQEYCRDFKIDLKQITSRKFTKLVPHTTRPYGKIYAY